MTTCKNCAFEYEGKFCPQCGQKSKTKRITTRAVFEEVRRSFFHYDRGFAYTVIQLFRRPGHTIREFIEGRRVMHVKPVKFMLWATALNFLVFHFVGFDKDLVNRLTAEQGQQAPTNFQVKFSQYLFDHPSIIMFLMIPNIALFSWLFFRKSRYNYAENFVLNAYLMGEMSMFGIVLTPIAKYVGGTTGIWFNLKMAAQGIFWLGYMGWAYAQFFQPPRKWVGWLKSALALFCGYLLLLIVISILTALIVILFFPLLKSYFQQ